MLRKVLLAVSVAALLVSTVPATAHAEPARSEPIPCVGVLGWSTC